jgi:hypothetical protein
MRITKLRIQNYKSFSDSGWIELNDGFNVLVGKNSSGKTALLEAFRFNNTPNLPHRNIRQHRGEASPPNSQFDFEFVPSKGELFGALSRQRASLQLPVQPGVQAQEFAKSFFETGKPTFRLRFYANGVQSLQYPSHAMFELPARQKNFTQITLSDNNRSYSASGLANGEQDTAWQLVTYLLPDKVYAFKAERFNISRLNFTEQHILENNAANLPLVLFSLIGNPELYAQYVRHVNEIFPYIKYVAVVGQGNQVGIQLWPVDTATKREDLRIPLAESGTGVGQALAILYVAMTTDRGVIAIDEPNSFLHPGAAKKLIEILAQYKHQYLLSTHSPEIIAAADPDAVFIVRLVEGESVVEKLERKTISSQRRVLAEIGVSAADVFGMERIVWVEGPTEEKCFPLILQRERGTVKADVDFVAVRSVDEIVRKAGTDEVVLDIYKKLTDANAILPNSLHFSFDREKRSEAYIASVETETKGTVKFLPARCYECFLVHPHALTAIICSEAKSLGLGETSEALIIDWLDKNAETFSGSEKWMGAYRTGEWWRTVDAPRLLTSLFSNLIQTDYGKIRHGRALTEWILENDPDHFAELTKYVLSLVEK